MGAGQQALATPMKQRNAVDGAGDIRDRDIVKVAHWRAAIHLKWIDNNTLPFSEYGTTGKPHCWTTTILLTNAMEENSWPRPLSQPVEARTMCRSRTLMSDLSAISDVVTDQSERKRLRVMKMLDHRLALERTAIWGEKKKDATNKRYLTGGVIQFIASNVYNASGTLTEKKWNAFTELGFKYGSKEKVFVCGPAVGSLLNDFAAGKIQTTSGEKTYGIRLKMLSNLSSGVLSSRLNFEQDYASWGALLDMRYIVIDRKRPF